MNSTSLSSVDLMAASSASNSSANIASVRESPTDAATRTLDEQIQAQLPEAWRDDQIAKLDPDTAQRYEDARRDELRDIKDSLMKKRRPDYYGLSDGDDFGGADDCF